MRKKLLNITLFSALLGAGLLAYADGDGEVKLTNGTSISWASFVEAINSPETVTGNIDDVPKTNKFYTDWQSAKIKEEEALTAKNNATDAVSAAEAALNGNDDKIGALQTLQNANEGLETAQANMAAIRKRYTDAIATAQSTYNTASDSVPILQNQLESYKVDQTNYQSQLSTANTKLTSLNVSLNQINDSIADLKYTEKTDVRKTYVSWLETNYDAAQSYLEAWEKISDNDDVTIELYYKITTVTLTIWPYNKVTNLQISFVKPADITGWDKATTTVNFYYALLNKSGEGENVTYTPITFNTIKIYLGENLKDKDDNAVTNTIEVKPSSTNPDVYPLNVIPDAVSKLQSLMNNTDYYSTTTSTERKYEDAKLKGELDQRKIAVNKSIGETNQTIAEYTAKLNGGTYDKKQYDGVNNQINETQGAIDVYKNTRLPALEKKVKELEDNLEKNIKEDKDYEEANTALTNAQTAVDDAQKAVDNAQSALTKANELVKTTEAAYTAAKEATESAESDLQNEANRLAQANYATIKLTNDVTVEASVNNSYSGTIDAQGHIITNNAANPIFNGGFKGQLSNAAVNGTFANSTAGSIIDNVVVWTGSQGRIYDEEGKPTPYTTLGAVGFAARDRYGIDFATKNLVTKADNTTVYQFTVNDLVSGKKVDKTNYIVIKEGKYYTGATTELSIPTNFFAKSTTNDVENLNLTNIYYTADDGTYKCNNVVIKDGSSFYCPEQITTSNISYNRVLKAGYNSVCLPFALNAEKLPAGVKSACKYDQEENGKFWFTKVSSSVPANEPALIVTSAQGEFDFSQGGDVTLEATQLNQFAFGGTFANEPGASKSLGTYKRVNAEEFLGASNANYIYYLSNQDGKAVFMQAIASGEKQAYFGAFRMGIASTDSYIDTQRLQAPGEMPGVRQFGIRDEFGNDITNDVITGVEGVSAPTDFSVIAGQGEIIFNSDSNYGKVEIFSLDGRVAAVADVLEGTTSVNVVKGIYIVMGKKVMVK